MSWAEESGSRDGTLLIIALWLPGEVHKYPQKLIYLNQMYHRKWMEPRLRSVTEPEKQK